MMRSPDSGLRPVVSVSRTICLMLIWHLRPAGRDASAFAAAVGRSLDRLRHSYASTLRRTTMRPCPQNKTGQHHRHAQPLAHAEAGARDEVREETVGFAEPLGDEAENAIADEKGPRHLAQPPRPARIDPQQR